MGLSPGLPGAVRGKEKEAPEKEATQEGGPRIPPEQTGGRAALALSPGALLPTPPASAGQALRAPPKRRAACTSPPNGWERGARRAGGWRLEDTDPHRYSRGGRGRRPLTLPEVRRGLLTCDAAGNGPRNPRPPYH